MFHVDEVGELVGSADFMQICFYHEVIVETTSAYASSINWKLGLPDHIINNMVRIQLLSHGHSYNLWCLCCHYIFCIISFLINIHLVTAPIVSWYKHRNISYTIPFVELVIWGWKFYIVNSKQRKMSLYLCTNKDPCVCPPDIYPSILLPSADFFILVYSNSKKFIIYFDPSNRHINRNFNLYIDYYDVKLRLSMG